MKRVLEPQLMEDDEQARAYAQADFEEAHNSFVERFRTIFRGRNIGPHVLDLGCGPGDISIRFARAFPESTVDGVDGSPAMLQHGEGLLEAAGGIASRVHLMRGMLPGARLPRRKYDVVISNSLLHHLPDPQVLWNTVAEYATRGCPVFVMDLLRPTSIEQANAFVEEYAAREPDVLKRDFYNSLLAAFEIDEVRDQLEKANLAALSVEQISDRHLIVAGSAP